MPLWLCLRIESALVGALRWVYRQPTYKRYDSARIQQQAAQMLADLTEFRRQYELRDDFERGFVEGLRDGFDCP